MPRTAGGLSLPRETPRIPISERDGDDPSACGARSLNTISTGVDGLDEVLLGGVSPGRVYLVEGDPGAGKTTLAMQFLLEGAKRGERGIIFALSESRRELLAIAESHGWDLTGIDIDELGVPADPLHPESDYTIFNPAEVELGEAVGRIISRVRELQPTRVVFDSLSELRLLSQSPLRFRRQVLALKQFFGTTDMTVLIVDDRSGDKELGIQSIAHGVFSLEHDVPVYGPSRRRIRVTKLRGQAFRAGYHDFALVRGGMQVYSRLIAAEHRADAAMRVLSSGIPELDHLLGGGVDSGTSTLLMGPAGSGKSSVATQFAVAAVERGERAAVLLFDESLATFFRRADGLGIAAREHYEAGRLTVRPVDPAELSPDGLSSLIRFEVERTGDLPALSTLVIDSLNGYLQSMPGENFLITQLHELLAYLGHKGVASFLLVAQQGLVGTAMQAPVEATYLADTVVLFRFFESRATVRRAISTVKKRSGPHERTIRELTLSANGIGLSEPLAEFHGVLTGIPAFMGAGAQPLS